MRTLPFLLSFLAENDFIAPDGDLMNEPAERALGNSNKLFVRELDSGAKITLTTKNGLIIWENQIIGADIEGILDAIISTTIAENI